MAATAQSLLHSSNHNTWKTHQPMYPQQTHISETTRLCHTLHIHNDRDIILTYAKLCLTACDHISRGSTESEVPRDLPTGDRRRMYTTPIIHNICSILHIYVNVSPLVNPTLIRNIASGITYLRQIECPTLHLHLNSLISTTKRGLNIKSGALCPAQDK